MSAEPLYASLAAVKDEPTFLQFAGLLAAEEDGNTASIRSGSWANQTIEDFLMAANAWTTDAQASESKGPNQSDLWKLFAKYLLAAHGYE